MPGPASGRNRPEEVKRRAVQGRDVDHRLMQPYALLTPRRAEVVQCAEKTSPVPERTAHDTIPVVRSGPSRRPVWQLANVCGGQSRRSRTSYRRTCVSQPPLSQRGPALCFPGLPVADSKHDPTYRVHLRGSFGDRWVRRGVPSAPNPATSSGSTSNFRKARARPLRLHLLELLLPMLPLRFPLLGLLQPIRILLGYHRVTGIDAGRSRRGANTGGGRACRGQSQQAPATSETLDREKLTLISTSCPFAT